MTVIAVSAAAARAPSRRTAGGRPRCRHHAAMAKLATAREAAHGHRVVAVMSPGARARSRIPTARTSAGRVSPSTRRPSWVGAMSSAAPIAPLPAPTIAALRCNCARVLSATDGDRLRWFGGRSCGARDYLSGTG